MSVDRTENPTFLLRFLGHLWRSLVVGLGYALAVLIGWAPMIQASFLPPVQRLIHGIEITVDSALYGLAIAWLLGIPAVKFQR